MRSKPHAVQALLATDAELDEKAVKHGGIDVGFQGFHLPCLLVSVQRSHINAQIADARQTLQERLEDGCFDDAWRHARDSILRNDAQLVSLESAENLPRDSGSFGTKTQA